MRWDNVIWTSIIALQSCLIINNWAYKKFLIDETPFLLEIAEILFIVDWMDHYSTSICTVSFESWYTLDHIFPLVRSKFFGSYISCAIALNGPTLSVGQSTILCHFKTWCSQALQHDDSIGIAGKRQANFWLRTNEEKPDAHTKSRQKAWEYTKLVQHYRKNNVYLTLIEQKEGTQPFVAIQEC